MAWDESSSAPGEDATAEAVLIADLREAFDSCSFRAEPASWRGSSSGRAGSALLGTASHDLGGRRLGDFQLLYEIGRGGMGVVYRARQVSLNRDVALKLLPTLSSANPSRARRFRTESLAVARLAHPNVIPVFAHGEQEGVLYYAMELLDGASLDSAIHGRPSLLSSTFVHDRATQSPDADEYVDRIADSEKTPERPERPVRRSTQEYRHLANLLADVAEGLAHAHSQGVLHRDIKPQNLLIAGDGRLRIADFGLAQLTDEPNLTMTGEVMGTPAYLAPEQVRKTVGPIDERTDVYALGATLYELLTARQPFRGETRDQVLHQIADCEPESPRRVEPTIPLDLETICLRAMSKTPSDRYESARAMAEDLRRFSTGRPVLASRAGAARKTRLWIGRHKGTSTASVAAVALVVLATVLSFSVRASRRTDANLLLDRAYEQLVYQDYREPEWALDDIDRAEALGADEQMLSRVRAITLLGSSENVAAIELLEDALQRFPGDRGTAYLLAWAQWRDHRRDASRSTFSRAEKMPGELASDEWFFRGLAVHFADAVKALDSYEHAIALRVADHQFHPQAALHLARAANQHMYSTRTLDKLEDADSSLRELVRHGQYEAYPYYLLSITHRLAGEILSAENPSDGGDDAWAQFEEALDWAVEGQSVDPSYDRPVAAEAACLERMGRFEDALDARGRALEVASTSGQRCETYHYRWRLHYWLRQPVEALDDVERHAACLPESPFYAHVYPALVLADLDDFDAAVEHARALADESPADPLQVIWSASTLRWLGQLDEADALLESRREQLVFPLAETARTDDWLPALYDFVSGEGDWETLADLIAQQPSSRTLRGEAHYHAGVMSLVQGHRAEAFDHFERAVHSADGALGYTFHAGVVLERMRLEPSWPGWMESAFSEEEATPGGTDGTVHHAKANASLGEDHRD